MTKTMKRPSLTALVAALLLAATLAGCASSAKTAYRRGEAAAERELWDQAVVEFAKAVSLDPADRRYRMVLNRAKLQSSIAHFDRAKRYSANGQLELALEELQQTVILDPSNEYAVVELKRVQDELEWRRKGPSEMQRAEAVAQQHAQVLGPPRLDPRSNVPIVLNFPDSTIEEVYGALSKISGINFLYDDKLGIDKKTSVDLANVTFEKAMDVLMLTHKHFYKVIDEFTILIAEDTRQKRQELEDQVIRTFYLSSADTKQVQTAVRSLLETRRIYENPDLNAITIKDTPEKIKIAERIIRANDKAKGEVVVDVELLEIQDNYTQRLGFDLSSKSLSLVFGGGDEFVPLNNLDIVRNSAAWTLGPIPSVVFSFLKSDSNAQSLARPQLRILEGEEGNITIGDRVPIPATTFNTSQTIGGNIVPVTSFTYQNVGIIVNISPRVHHNKEITLEMQFEISAVTGNVDAGGGVSQPIIGTRTVETTIRLADGETNLLAGLIREDDRTSLSGVPGLSDIPWLKRVFGVTQDERSNSDIVLSVTPHIIRVPNIEPIDLVPLWVGTEDNIQLRGIARNALGESPFSSLSPWEEIESQLSEEFGGRSVNRPEDLLEPEAQAEPVPTAGSDETPEPEPAVSETPPSRRKAGAQTEPNSGAAGAAAAAGAAGAATADAMSDAVEPFAEPAVPQAASEPEPLDDPADDAGAAAAPERPQVAQLRLSAMQPSVSAGDPVAVEVAVDGAANVASVNFQIRYDPTVLQFVPPGQSAGFMEQGGAISDLQVVETAEGGTLVVSSSRSGEGASGSGTLMRLNFVALEAGTSQFRFASAQVRDPSGQLMPASFRSAAVEVTE